MMEHEAFQAAIDAFNLFDIDYFKLVFSEEHIIPLSQIVLRTFIERDDIDVTEAHIEHEVPNILGRGIRMDIRARDASGKLYNVEVQRRNSGATPKRSRFNSSIMDANYSVSGDDEQLKQLPESYVLFITKNDIFKRGKAIYHIERVVLETGELFGDEAHILYINGAYDDVSTKAGRLIHDFRCTDAGKMFFSEFAERTRELKETKEGREMMGETMERFAAAYSAGREAAQVISMGRDYNIPDAEIVERLIAKIPCSRERAEMELRRYDAAM